VHLKQVYQSKTSSQIKTMPFWKGKNFLSIWKRIDFVVAIMIKKAYENGQKIENLFSKKDRVWCNKILTCEYSNIKH